MIDLEKHRELAEKTGGEWELELILLMRNDHMAMVEEIERLRTEKKALQLALHQYDGTAFG